MTNGGQGKGQRSRRFPSQFMERLRLHLSPLLLSCHGYIRMNDSHGQLSLLLRKSKIVTNQRVLYTLT